MEYFEKAVFSVLLLLLGAFLVLYICRPWILKHFKVQDQTIVLVEQRFIPKIGQASVLSVSGVKYLVVSNANAIAISAVHENSEPINTQPENN